ncbi:MULTISPECIES: cobalt ECF transporter T component CbiQ [Kamptonema]|uniref:cobalt ECF transporter T component CbiQ n=1 Tax=Kamptonema TaxID=1501433 RepID=UPI0001DAD61A|nr:MULTISPECIES: cobalt ECF transporter T component CbiQ [Kamptonema]CBN55941.1 cobalt transport protein [Kamptonema sp. PCC 6506]
MSLKLDTLAYTNSLSNLPPEQKLIFAIVVLTIALFAHPPVQGLIIIWMSIWTIIYARTPPEIYWRMLYLAALFWLTSLPAIAINGVSVAHISLIQTDALQGMTLGSNYFYISRNGSELALTIFSRSLSSVCCMYFLLLTVPFAAILQTLRRLGLPAILTELLLLMYRFIFTLLSATQELWIAQQSRAGYRTWRTSINSLSLLVGQLFHRTMLHYHQFSLGLEARGFTGELRVWHSRRYCYSQRYALEAIIGCGVLIGLECLTNVTIFARN